jgi:hypothetical protein
MTSGLNLEEKDLEKITSKLLLLKYSSLFNKYLCSIDDSTKHIIRNNKELNNLFDLFLDFIIDSNQHLDYINAKEQAKEIENVGSN